MPKTWLTEIDESISEFRQIVSEKVAHWTGAGNPHRFLEAEQEAHAAARKLADDVMAAVLREILDDVAFQVRCLAGAHSVGAYRSKGFKDTLVTLLGGHTYSIRTQYLLPLSNRRRRHRRRGVGLWPCLVALGIFWNTSPAFFIVTPSQQRGPPNT